MSILAIAHDPTLVMLIADALPNQPITHLSPSEITPEAWTGAALVLLVDDVWHDPRVAKLPRRSLVWAVGTDSRAAVESGVLAAAERGYTLPAENEELNDAVVRVLNGHPPDRCLITVVGATGGVGSSCLAAAMTVHAALLGLRAVLIDLDPLAGGPGRLFASPVGQVANGSAYEIGFAEPGSVSAAAAKAGIRAAAADYDVVVIDCPRHVDAARTAIAYADHVLLLAPTTTQQHQSVAAAARFAWELNRDTALVVRRPRGDTTPTPEAIVENLGLEMAAVLEHDEQMSGPVPKVPGADPFGPLALTARKLLSRYLDTREREIW